MNVFLLYILVQVDLSANEYKGIGLIIKNKTVLSGLLFEMNTYINILFFMRCSLGPVASGNMCQLLKIKSDLRECWMG